MKSHPEFAARLTNAISLRLALILTPIVSGAALGAGTSGSSTAPSASSCRALVEVGNDLYLVSSSGAPLVRFTSNGSAKRFPALAPDASKVAFLTDTSPDTIVVVDSAGHQGSFPASAADSAEKPKNAIDSENGPLIGLTWGTSNVLQLDHHIGLNNERFAYYQVPYNLASALPLASIGFRIALDVDTLLHPGSNPSVGAACAITTPSNNLACIQGSDVRVNGTAVYSNYGYDFTNPTQSLALGVGQIVSTPGTPSFQVQVSSIQNGITLRVTLPTGNWTESTLSTGSILPVTLDDQRFGFLPTITDAKNGSVKLDIFQSASGTQSFDPAIAWHNFDGTLAIIERTATGRNLTALRHDGLSAQWKPIGSAALNISEPLIRMQFANPSALLVQTSQRFGWVPITVNAHALPSIPPSVQVGTFAELPSRLSVRVSTSAVTTPVLDWSCESTSP